MTTWYLFIIIEMGILRPPIHYEYKMPSEQSCKDSLDKSRIAMNTYNDAKTTIMFCAPKEDKK